MNKADSSTTDNNGQMETNGDKDTRVEFISTKLIDKEDLDVLCLYLENRKASGGGDIIHKELDQSGRTLIVDYEEVACKKRVLEKQVEFFCVEINFS